MAEQHLDSDYLSPELARLLSMARTELDRHVNQDGNCRECHAPWPCEQVSLAAFTMGSL